MEPEAAQNIIHQKHPIPSSWHIHQSVSYSKYGFGLLMLISFMGRLVIYLSVAIKEVGELWSILIPRASYLRPVCLHAVVGFSQPLLLGSLSWGDQVMKSTRHCSGHSIQDPPLALSSPGAGTPPGRTVQVVQDRMAPR